VASDISHVTKGGGGGLESGIQRHCLRTIFGGGDTPGLGIVRRQQSPGVDVGVGGKGGYKTIKAQEDYKGVGKTPLSREKVGARHGRFRTRQT